MDDVYTYSSQQDTHITPFISTTHLVENLSRDRTTQCTNISRHPPRFFYTFKSNLSKNIQQSDQRALLLIYKRVTRRNTLINAQRPHMGAAIDATFFIKQYKFLFHTIHIHRDVRQIFYYTTDEDFWY